MRALLAITARELRERWTLPLAMFVSGFVPLFLVRYVDITARPLAMIAAVAAAWGIALLMGGSVIARDLADGRLAFFFARPVSWWSIAGGKLLAALLMSVAAPVAGVLPAVLADWNPTVDAKILAEIAGGGGLALKLALLLTLVGFGHVASVVYRARSTWAAVDFLLVGVCAWGGVWLFYAFKRLGVVLSGPPSSAWTLLLPLLLVAAVPLTAAAVQMAAGRSDLRRGHVALSLTFWSGVLVWLAALGGLLLRERAVTPADLSVRGITAVSPDGRLLGLEGTPRGGRAAFVYDAASGRSLRLGLGSSPAFSADGRYVAWVEEAPFWRHDRPTEIQLARLDDKGFAAETVELATRLPQEGIVGLALSAKAERLAIVQNATLSVYEIPSGRTLSTTTAADGTWMAAAFLKDGRAAGVPPREGGARRSGHRSPARPRRGRLDGRRRTDRARFASMPSDTRSCSPRPTRTSCCSTSRSRRATSRSTTLARGRLVRRFSGEDGFQVQDAYLLEDGGVALIEAQPPSRRLRLAREGQPDRVALLPEGSAVISGGLPQGLLAIGRFVPAHGLLAGETLFFSSDTAEPRGSEPGLLPALRFGLGPSRRVVPASAAQLFVSDSGELVRFDPSTRERRLLLPAPPAAR